LIVTKWESKIETSEIIFFRSVADYTRKDQIRNTTVGEQLSVFNLSNIILKPRSQVKHHVLRMEDRRIPKTNVTHNPTGR
jgi:hypothetical protein